MFIKVFVSGLGLNYVDVESTLWTGNYISDLVLYLVMYMVQLKIYAHHCTTNIMYFDVYFSVLMMMQKC